MLGLTLASLRARPLRALLTAFSIVLGVAMISGTFVVTGQINRAFSQIFDAVNVKNDVVDRAAHGQRQQRRLPGALPGFRAEARRARCRASPRRPARSTRSARSSPSRTASPSASAADRRRSSARVLDAARPLRSGHVRARPPRHPHGRDRADRGHGQEGQRRCRLDGRARDAGRAQAPARLRHLPIGTTASLGGALVSSIPLADAQHWYSPGRAVHAGQPPGGAGRLEDDAARPRARRPRRHASRSRPARRRPRPTRRASPTSSTASSGPALLAFGGVAVLVGAFIIFNMFSITVAQRIREIAMLRTLGASRRQILTSVLLEALTTGLIGTLIGIFAGLLIALGINALFDAVGFGLPSTSPQLATHGRRARARRGARRDAGLGADPRRARDQDPADGRAARGRDAAARALRALVAHPRRALRRWPAPR